MRTPRFALLTLLAPLLLSACATAPRGERVAADAVRIEVENGGEFDLRVRACSPFQCTGYLPLASGATTAFTFPLPVDHHRFVVTGKDGDRVAAQVPLDILEPGVSRVTLRPTPRRGQGGRPRG